MGSPLDGLSAPIQFSQLLTRWGPVRFESGGNFTLCYRYASVLTVMPLTISVRGIIGSTHKVFCWFGSETDCSTKLPVWSLASPDVSRLALIPLKGACGNSSLAAPFSEPTSVSLNLTESDLIHSFGTLLSTEPLASFTLCYCPGYEATWNGHGACTASTTNFVQEVGVVILTTISLSDPLTGTPASVHPRLKFDLTILCGSGGCSPGSSQRIKIVDAAAANLAPYFSATGGCRTALESSRYLGPSNCASGSSTSCQLAPSSTSSAVTRIEFKNLQLKSEPLNGVTLERQFDVCFCDSACDTAASWFRVGSFSVKRISVRFTRHNAEVIRPCVDAPFSLELFTQSASTFRTSGSQSRELKLIADNAATIDSSECLRNEQASTLVSGHDCFSITNCAQPEFSSSTLMRYGSDSIRIHKAGFVAVCFCNAECSLEQNWLVVDRVLVAGPTAEQRWTATQGLALDVTLTGWGMGDSDRIFVVPSTSTCEQSRVVSDSIFGPDDVPELIQGSNIDSMVDAGLAKVGLNGVLIRFAANHGLQDGDWIELSGIETGDTDVNAMLNRNHKVALFDSATVHVDATMPDFPKSINLARTRWVRSNVAKFKNLVITKPGQYIVCCLSGDQASAAGSLLVTAPRISPGYIGLGSVVPNTAVPVVFQFSTSALPRYVTGVGVTELVVVFAASAMLIPLDEDSAPLDFNIPTEPFLDNCGSVFLEANSVKGFPQPSGCFWKLDQTRGTDRIEVHMLFFEANGLAHADTVSIVMLGQTQPGLSPVIPADAPVEIWILTGESVIEMFALRPTRTVAPLIGEAPRVDFAIITPAGDYATSLVELSGFCVNTCSTCTRESDCGNQDLTKKLCESPAPSNCTHAISFSFEFTVSSGAVFPGSQVRLLLFPLNDWAVQLSPLITCVAATVGRLCGANAFTSVSENVVSGPVLGDMTVSGGQGANVLKFTLSSQTSRIDEFTVLRFSVASLRLPENGFFPTSVWAEILPPDSSLGDPVFVKSSVRFFKLPSIGVLQLVKPEDAFVAKKGDKNYVVYLSTVVGVLLSDATQIRVALPPGFVCRMEPVLNCNGKDPACMHSGVTASSLAIFTGKTPSGRGILGSRTLDGEDREAAWSKGQNDCALSLKSSSRVYSGSSVFLAVNSDVPDVGLQASAASNVWSVVCVQEDIWSIPKQAVCEEQAYVSSIAVLGALSNVTIMPSVFAVSAVNDLFIAFTAENACGLGSAVLRIDAPTGFQFSAACYAYALDESYFAAETDSRIFPLPIKRCVATVGMRRASVETSEPLVAGRQYGFRLRVKNPPSSQPAGEWKLTTLADSGTSVADSGCDSDPHGVVWQVSMRAMQPFAVSIPDMRPSGKPVSITLFPIRVSATTSGRMTITAPAGYRWSYKVSDFDFKSEADGGVVGADASLPLSIVPVGPISAPFNRLDLEYLSGPLVEGKTYGISASIIVPRNSPTSSANVFTIQIGDGEAAVAAAPAVQAVVGADISYQSSIAGATNLVCVSVRTVSLISRGGSLMITVPGGFQFPNCVISGAPSDSLCHFKHPWLRIVAGVGGIPPGRLHVSIIALNPAVPSPAANWTIHSLASNRSMLDFPSSVIGFPVTTTMQGGYVQSGSLRDDRPGRTNSVVFSFTPTRDTSGTVEIVIKAPSGFSIHSNCAAIAENGEWPVNAEMSCEGLGSEAKITVSVPLTTGRPYSLRLGGLVNRMTTAIWNFWSVTYNAAESTVPSLGFKLWSFENMALQALNVATSQVGTQVKLRFTCVNDLPSGSVLRIVAPMGFSFASPCFSSVECESDAREGVSVGCSTYATSSERITLAVNGGSGFRAGRPYMVSLQVNTPDVDVEARPWYLTSFASLQAVDPLDSGTVNGFAIVSHMRRFELVSISSRGGNDAVSVSLVFEAAVVPGDIGRLTFPVGYVLSKPGSKVCVGVSLLPVVGTTVACSGNSVDWAFIDSDSGAVAVTVATTNPAFIPDNNSFAMKVFRRKTLVSMGSFAGPVLIPKLANVSIAFEEPVVASSGSMTNVTVRFVTHSACDTILISGRVGSLLFDPSSVSIVTPLGAGTAFTTRLGGQRIPATTGRSSWTISTWNNKVLQDETRDVAGPVVIGRIDITSGSSLQPRIYGSKSALLVIEFVSSVPLPSGADIVLTLPPGYVVEADSLEPLVGIDWGDWVVQPDGVLKITLSRMMQGGSVGKFSLRVDLPVNAQISSSWRMEAVTGVTLLARNDGRFEGFWLISKLPFRVVPESPTPSAVVKVRLAYVFPSSVTADRSIHLLVTAPPGFVFSSAASCLGASGSAWVSCIGTGNVASVLGNSRSVTAGPGWVDVIATNPSSTPVANTWQLAVFLNNDASSYTNIDSAIGYTIKAMAAMYVGTNRLGVKGPAFFSFQISANVTSYFQVVITPARRYTLLCEPRYRVGMESAPPCSGNLEGVADAPIVLTVAKAEVLRSRSFTVGVTVVTPTSRVSDDVFALTILDALGSTIDANSRISGPSLDQIFVAPPRLECASPVPGEVSSVTVTLRIDAQLSAEAAVKGTWLSIKIQAPDNFIFSAPDTVSISGDLPLAQLRPVVTAGNRLFIKSDPMKVIKASEYKIVFQVMNPRTVPSNNVWVVSINRGETPVFVAPLGGYDFD